MAAMPFLCNEVLLDHFNLPRVIQVVFQMYRNVQEYYTSFPLPIFNFLLVVSINIKLRPDKYNSSNNREVVLTEVHASVKNLKFKNPRKVFQSLNNTYSRHCSLVPYLDGIRTHRGRVSSVISSTSKPPRLGHSFYYWGIIEHTLNGKSCIFVYLMRYINKSNQYYERIMTKFEFKQFVKAKTV